MILIKLIGDLSYEFFTFITRLHLIVYFKILIILIVQLGQKRYQKLSDLVRIYIKKVQIRQNTW